ncbi:MAG: hypothetical protein J5780_05530 [Treponema sp.]|nr:hypothetical protein [Treponema sp.]
MKKSFFLPAALFFLIPSLVYSRDKRGAQELVFAENPVYEKLCAVAAESGRTDLTDSTPVTVGEIRLHLKEIPYDELSSAGKRNYDSIVSWLDEELPSLSVDAFSFLASPELSLEGQYKTNDELGWVYDRYSRKPFISIPLSINAGDIMTMNMDVLLRQNKGCMLHDDNYTNIPFASSGMDINFPETAYFSAGSLITENTGINFRLGIGSQSIGRTSLGSIIWNNTLTGATFANLKFYSPNFAWNMNVTELGVDRYMYMHGFDLRLFKKLSITAMEGVLVNAPFELRFLNPFTIYHGMSAWKDYDSSVDATHVSSYFAVKLNFVPWRYFRIYGLFAMDQFQTSYEVENWPNDVTPNAMAGQAGVEGFIPFEDGYFRLCLEGSYTEPFMYIKETPAWTFVRTYEENIGDMPVFYEWMGSPMGPDTVAGEFSLGYEKPDFFSVSLSYRLMARGEYSGDRIFKDFNAAGDNKWGGSETDFAYKDGADADGDGYPDDLHNWAYPNKEGQGKEEAKRRQSFSAPHGTAEYVNRISLRGTFCANDFITLRAQPSYVIIFNKDNKSGCTEQGFEFALSCSVKIPGILK